MGGYLPGPAPATPLDVFVTLMYFFSFRASLEFLNGPILVPAINLAFDIRMKFCSEDPKDWEDLGFLPLKTERKLLVELKKGRAFERPIDIMSS